MFVIRNVKTGQISGPMDATEAGKFLVNEGAVEENEAMSGHGMKGFQNRWNEVFLVEYTKTRDREERRNAFRSLILSLS